MNSCRPLDLALRGLLVACLLTLAGCGKREYERRVLAGSGGGAGGGALGPAVKIPGTDLTIRLPSLVDASAKAYNEGSPEPDGNGAVNPARLNPPFLTIPGLRVCYEKQLADEATSTNFPMFWYVGALEPQAPLPEGKEIDQYAMDALTAAFPPPTNKPPTADTVTVNNIPWKRVTFTGTQSFIGLAGNIRNEPGTFQMLTGEVNGRRVIIAFRVPNLFLTSTKAIDVAALVAASVAPEAPPAPAEGAPAQ